MGTSSGALCATEYKRLFEGEENPVIGAILSRHGVARGVSPVRGAN